MELTWNCHLLLVLDIYTLPETNIAPFEGTSEFSGVYSNSRHS